MALADGLKTLWHMNNDWQDSSNNGHNGTANGAIFTTIAKLGSHAGSFDGVDDYVSIPDHADWNFINGDFTVSLWVRFNVINTTVVFYNQQPYNTGTNNITFQKLSDGSLYMNCYQNGYKYNIYTTTPPTFNTGVWYHIVYIRAGNTPYIYVNGVSQTLTIGTPFGASVADIASNVELGGAYNDYQRWWLNGYLDEFAVWSRALSTNEISDLWNNGNGVEIVPFAFSFLLFRRRRSH